MLRAWVCRVVLAGVDVGNNGCKILLFRVFPSILAAKFQKEKKRMVNLHGLEHTCGRGAVAVQIRGDSN